MASRSLHFILVPFPAQGHISPILHLSKLLAQQGAAVTVANIEPVHTQLQQGWQSPGLDVRLVGIPFPLDAPLGIEGSWYSRSRIYEFMAALSQMRWAFEDLVRDIISGDRSQAKFVLVADYFVGWHDEVAHKLNIVGVSYWPGNAYWLSVHYHLPDLQSKKDIPVRDPEKVVDYIPGVPPLRLKDFPAYVQPESVECSDILAKYPLEDKWVLVNSTYELQPRTFQELQELLGKKVIPIGPLFCKSSSSSLRSEEDCTSWLGSQAPRSVLYVSFGSIATLTDSEFRALAEGLESCGIRFLWVIRSELIPARSVDYFQDFVKRIESTKQGLTVRWAPQLQVLSHEAVGGFLSHCGWNSMFESISAGVPILGCPRISEQRLNCALVVEGWRIGTRLSIDVDNAAEVITEFMTKSKLLRERVVELRKLMDAATSADGSSTNNLAYFFRELCST